MELSASDNTQYLISVASDGIWDCWKYEHFAEYLFNLLAQQSGDNSINLDCAFSICRL